jgi:hypothetical protein
MAINRSFTAITSEGGLLPSDFLLALLDHKSDIKGLDPVTYGLAPGERIGEQVNRSWNRLKGCWANFQVAIANKLPGEFTTTETRERWLLPIFHELDFGRLVPSRPIEIDGKSYPISHVRGSVPIHLVGTHLDLDRRTPGAVGAAKASPHSLVQQVLNASKDHVWGIISNGYTLRLLRDNVALTRIAYVEWDLQTILDGDLYPEFFLLWLVCHQSRFEVPEDGRPEKCWLEKWKKQAEEKGLRALENLRPGVERAIEAIGTGLVSHKSNQALLTRLSSGQLSTQDLYRQILRIIYRMLFLFVAEDRGLLHPPVPGEESGRGAIEEALKARRRYKQYYSISRLRTLTLHRTGTPHPDLWQIFQLASQKLGTDEGCPEIALPALGGFLWSQEATPDTNNCLLSNRHFLLAAHALAFVRDGNIQRAIDYKNLGSEELGSVYEGLLELHPIVNADSRTFELESSAGHERKTSGSYYTPDSLVQCLLDSALEPVIAETIKGKEGAAAAEALLQLKICDPAVGSGHFLIAAAHRLAKRLAAARTGEEEPSPEAVRSAIRDVIGRCLYGVDINPMAAELCRVSLWLEALEPGKPLSFLDHQIRVGNSLLGATPELIAAGLPDEAFEPIEGDDKKFCSALKKQNKRERVGQRNMLHLMVAESQATYGSIESRTRRMDEAPDDTISEVLKKAEHFHRLVVSPGYRHKQQVADAWCAAFVWRKQAGSPFEALSTDTIRRLEKDPNALDSGQQSEVESISHRYQFFHWYLAFPEVFAKGGFDCVLGNPPWERVKLQEKEWFAERSPEIANAQNAAARKRLIEALTTSDPSLYRQFREDSRKAEGESHLLRHTGRYPLCGRGDINVYTVFAEGMRNLLNEMGRAGCVLPSGIATDDTTKFFFQDVVDKKSLVSLYDFENRLGLFPDVDSRMKFCLFTCGRGLRQSVNSAEFVFFAHTVDDLRDPERRFTLSAEEIELLNPNTRTCPIFRSERDATLSLAVHRRHEVILREQSSNPGSHQIRVTRMFDMNKQRDLFKTGDDLKESGLTFVNGYYVGAGLRYVRLLEGKTFSSFDHRFAVPKIRLQGGIRTGMAIDVSEEQHSNPSFLLETVLYADENNLNIWADSRLTRRYLLGFMNVTSATNHRTSVSAILPDAATDYSIRVVIPTMHDPHHIASLAGLFNSFAYDYLSRQKLQGLNFSDYITYQLAVPKKAVLLNQSQFIIPRVLELSYTAWDIAPFAKDCGWDGPPFKWDEKRRFIIRCELDALFFHFYLPVTKDGQWKPAIIAEGAVKDETPVDLAELKLHFKTPRAAVSYIMDTFPIVRRKEEEKNGEYRTKNEILKIYDAIQESILTGKPYQTHLDPSPGPPLIDLPDWKAGHPKPVGWPSHIHPPKRYEGEQDIKSQ